MDSVRPKRLKKRQTGRVGAVEAEFFNGLLGIIEVSELTASSEKRILVVPSGICSVVTQPAIPAVASRSRMSLYLVMLVSLLEKSNQFINPTCLQGEVLVYRGITGLQFHGNNASKSPTVDVCGNSFST